MVDGEDQIALDRRHLIGVGLLPRDHVDVVGGVVEVVVRRHRFEPFAQAVQRGGQHRRLRGERERLLPSLVVGLVEPRPAAEHLAGGGHGGHHLGQAHAFLKDGQSGQHVEQSG